MKANTLEKPAVVSAVAGILGKIGGRSRSPKKVAAARKNIAKAQRIRLSRVA